MIMEWIDTVMEWIKLVITGGVGAIISAPIQYYFAKRIELKKAELDKRKRLDEMEREVLPELWKQLNDVKARLTSCLFKSTDIDSFGQPSEEAIKIWEERGGVDKDGTWEQHISHKERISDEKGIKKIVNKHLPCYRKFCARNSIFLTLGVKTIIKAINAHLSEVCAAAWADNQFAFQDNAYDPDISAEEDERRDRGKENIKKKRKEAMTAYRKVIGLMEELEKIIQSKIFSNDTDADYVKK